MLTFLGVIFCLIVGSIIGVASLYFISCKNQKVRKIIIDKLNNCECSDGKCS